MNIIQCVNCNNKIDLEVGITIKNQKCNNCLYKYVVGKKYLKYDYASLLQKNFKKDYLLNQVLNNNGLLSYILQKKASLSIASREDVIRFRLFIEKTILRNLHTNRRFRILDIGCGPMKLPGYLKFVDKHVKKSQLYGIDPVDMSSFMGYRVVGTAEHMPFIDNYFDAVIYATSLDHVCSLDKSVRETYRIIKKNGLVLIWMSDRSRFLRKNIGELINNFLFYLKHSYRKEKYYLASNTHLYYIPDGAVDPFHSFNETPELIKKIFIENGFQLKEYHYNNVNEVFLAFQK